MAGRSAELQTEFTLASRVGSQAACMELSKVCSSISFPNGENKGLSRGRALNNSSVDMSGQRMQTERRPGTPHNHSMGHVLRNELTWRTPVRRQIPTEPVWQTLRLNPIQGRRRHARRTGADAKTGVAPPRTSPATPPLQANWRQRSKPPRNREALPHASCEFRPQDTATYFE